jgi:hypothetical protein
LGLSSMRVTQLDDEDIPVNVFWRDIVYVEDPDILFHLEVEYDPDPWFTMLTLIRLGWLSLLSTHIRNAAQIPVYKPTTPNQTKEC